MNKTLTPREAMQALLDGKWIQSQTSPPVRLSGNQFEIMACEGRKLTVEALCFSDRTWGLWSEPNPHTKGTFAWAREEAKRGQIVRRQHHRHTGFVIGGVENPAFETCAYYISDIYATDWEVAP